MIKGDQSFHQRNIFIKTAKPILILMSMADSNQPHTDKLRFMVNMVDYHIRMSMSDLNDEDYFPPITELGDDENEDGPGDNEPAKYLSDYEDVSNNEDVISFQDKN